MNQQPSVLKVCDPVFMDAEDRIQTQLCRRVVIQRRLRNFDDQENIFGCRIPAEVFIVLRSKQSKVGLRGDEAIQHDGPLCSHDGSASRQSNYLSVSPIDGNPMSRTDRTHDDEFPRNEFHALIGRQDSRFSHAETLVESEKPLCDVGHEKHSQNTAKPLPK
jgi:hypothetical protein